MNIVSFGGGTNSAALLIGLYKHKIPIDLITFADTGAEHPHTYQFIEIINQWLAEHGMPQITVVQYVGPVDKCQKTAETRSGPGRIGNMQIEKDGACHPFKV